MKMMCNSNTIILIFLFILTMPCFVSADEIREPAVSGAFYSDSKDELTKTVDDFLESAKQVEVKGKPLAIVVPHAGYIYSGRVAAEAFRQLKGKAIETFVVVGPCHGRTWEMVAGRRVMIYPYSFDGISVYSEGAYRTPLGLIKIDEKLATEITNMHEMIGYYPKAHRQEHAIEVELPFIQRIAPNAKIIPIIVGAQSSKSIQVLIDVFTSIMNRENTILIMSVDLSHFYTYDKAVKLDKAGLEAVEKLDAADFAKKVNSGKTDWDNPAGIIALLVAANRMGAEAKLLKYANSGDVTGDKSSVVGYSAVIITQPIAEKVNLDKSSREELLHIARSSIEKYLKSRKFPSMKPKDKELLKKCGAFVTLNKDGNLRGCIGYTQATMPLYETVSKAAISAATHDTRFKPVSEEELKEIQISISVLSPLKKIDDIKEIKVGTHGLVIRNRGGAGLLLPQVATEEGWDRLTFLQHTCLKAGLPTDAWREGADILVFTADVFGEK